MWCTTAISRETIPFTAAAAVKFQLEKYELRPMTRVVVLYEERVVADDWSDVFSFRTRSILGRHHLQNSWDQASRGRRVQLRACSSCRKAHGGAIIRNSNVYARLPRLAKRANSPPRARARRGAAPPDARTHTTRARRERDTKRARSRRRGGRWLVVAELEPGLAVRAPARRTTPPGSRAGRRPRRRPRAASSEHGSGAETRPPDRPSTPSSALL